MKMRWYLYEGDCGLIAHQAVTLRQARKAKKRNPNLCSVLLDQSLIDRNRATRRDRLMEARA